MDWPSNTALALALASITAGGGVAPGVADSHRAPTILAARCQFNSPRQHTHARGGGNRGSYHQAPPPYVPPPPPWGYMSPPPRYYDRDNGWYSPPNRQYRPQHGGRYRYESRDRRRY